MKDIIYINKTNGQVVDEGYPNSEPYIRMAHERIILEQVETDCLTCKGCWFEGRCNNNMGCTETTIFKQIKV